MHHIAGRKQEENRKKTGRKQEENRKKVLW